ncbi:MAG: hypothetical protein VW378_03690 [bacterium]
MKYLILISWLIGSLSYGTLHLHIKDTFTIDIPPINTSITKQVPLLITFSNIEETEIFICLSQDKKNDLYFHDINSNEFKENKTINEKLNLTSSYSATHINNTHSFQYKLLNNQDTPFTLKSFLLAINKDDVISGIITKDDISPINSHFYVSIDNIKHIPSGTYTDIFRVDLYKGSLTNKLDAELIESKSIKLIFNIPSYTESIIEKIKTTKNNQTIFIRTNSNEKIIAEFSYTYKNSQKSIFLNTAKESHIIQIPLKSTDPTLTIKTQ